MIYFCFGQALNQKVILAQKPTNITKNWDKRILYNLLGLDMSDMPFGPRPPAPRKPSREDLAAVGGRRVFAGLSDKGGMHLFATDITRVSLLELALFKLVFAPLHLRLTSKL